jgi:hypothetical protein
MAQTQKTCPGNARASGLVLGVAALRHPAAARLIALCLYCTTDDEPSPDVLS